MVKKGSKAALCSVSHWPPYPKPPSQVQFENPGVAFGFPPPPRHWSGALWVCHSPSNSSPNPDLCAPSGPLHPPHGVLSQSPALLPTQLGFGLFLSLFLCVFPEEQNRIFLPPHPSFLPQSASTGERPPLCARPGCTLQAHKGRLGGWHSSLLCSAFRLPSSPTPTLTSPPALVSCFCWFLSMAERKEPALKHRILIQILAPALPTACHGLS